MRDYYTLKEVIFGLRDEQLRIANLLDKLNSKLEINNDIQYKKSGFTFTQNNSLIFYLEEKNTLIKKILYALTLQFKKVNNGNVCYESLRTLGNGKYKIGGIGGMKVCVKDGEQDSFNKIISDILKDKFVGCSNLQINDMKLKDYHKHLQINPIRTKYNSLLDNKIDLISFNGKNDEVQIVNRKIINDGNCSKKAMDEILKIKFFRNDFPVYIQQIIDKNISKIQSKEIVLMTSRICKESETFAIDEQPNSFVLMKKINKRR